MDGERFRCGGSERVPRAAAHKFSSRSRQSFRRVRRRRGWVSEKRPGKKLSRVALPGAKFAELLTIRPQRSYPRAARNETFIEELVSAV